MSQEKQTQSLEKLVTEMMGVLTSFSNLLMEENKALRLLDFATLDNLQPEKRSLASQHHTLTLQLVDRRNDMSLLSAAIKQKFVELRTAFTYILKDNMQALETMKQSTQRLSNRIIEVARRTATQEQQTSYSAQGDVQSYLSATRSLALDESL